MRYPDCTSRRFDGFVELAHKAVLGDNFPEMSKIERNQLIGEVIVFINQQVNLIRQVSHYGKKDFNTSAGLAFYQINLTRPLAV